ncbi:hypothetical protein CMI42_02505 [Candidatus Pacearchaeota archaeon]|nr:hypothetical protein [Candidatus Pacearchaeota archaeon]
MSLKNRICARRINGQIRKMENSFLCFFNERIDMNPIIASMYPIELYSSNGELFISNTPQPFLNRSNGRIVFRSARNDRLSMNFKNVNPIIGISRNNNKVFFCLIAFL